LRIASDTNLIDGILPWVVLLLGLSLPSLAALLLGWDRIFAFRSLAGCLPGSELIGRFFAAMAGLL